MVFANSHLLSIEGCYNLPQTCDTAAIHQQIYICTYPSTTGRLNHYTYIWSAVTSVLQITFISTNPYWFLTSCLFCCQRVDATSQSRARSHPPSAAAGAPTGQRSRFEEPVGSFPGWWELKTSPATTILKLIRQCLILLSYWLQSDASK